jgi:hypothetical protein
MNLFTWNSPYYQLLKYLLFLLEHTVYISSQVATLPVVRAVGEQGYTVVTNERIGSDNR